MGNDENYEKLWAMARENEEAIEARKQREREQEYLTDIGNDALAEAMRTPVEDRVAKWKREADEMIGEQSNAPRCENDGAVNAAMSSHRRRSIVDLRYCRSHR